MSFVVSFDGCDEGLSLRPAFECEQLPRYRSFLLARQRCTMRSTSMSLMPDFHHFANSTSELIGFGFGQSIITGISGTSYLIPCSSRPRRVRRLRAGLRTGEAIRLRRGVGREKD